MSLRTVKSLSFMTQSLRSQSHQQNESQFLVGIHRFECTLLRGGEPIERQILELFHFDAERIHVGADGDGSDSSEDEKEEEVRKATIVRV
jgi:hypothetical protein